MKNKKLIICFSFLFVALAIILSSKNVYAETGSYTLQESISYAMSLLDDNMTDVQKAEILAKYCQEGNVYSTTASNNQTATGVFVDHAAVCAGYADAFRELCIAAGIPCQKIKFPTANHAFNICYLDGNWTYVDVTRGSNSKATPQNLYGKIFLSKKDIDSYYVTNANGSETLYTDYDSIPAGSTYRCMFFDGTETDYSGSMEEFPEGITISNDASSTSQKYYDDEYIYYAIKKYNSTNLECCIYKENRNTGTITTLANAFCTNYYQTGMVKDGDLLYYVGTDGRTIYSMNLSGNDKTKVYSHSGTEYITAIFVQDGYIYYCLDNSLSASTNVTWVKLKELSNGVTSGTYTLNNSNQQYILNYISTSEGITITSCEGIDGGTPSGQIHIPDTINGLNVVRVGKKAFYNLTSLTGNFNIPKYLRYIDSEAFYKCTGLTGITFNENLISIGDYAFYYCYHLAGAVDLSSTNVRYIGTSAFSTCISCTELNLNDNLLFISTSAFSSCKFSGVFEGPSNLKVIGRRAFISTNYYSALLPESLIILGSNAFNGLSDIAIFSEDMIYFTENGENEIYLYSGTDTETYAKENSISYIDLYNTVPTITLTETSVELYNGGDGIDLDYTISPRFFEASYYKKTWSSANKSVVTIDSEGIVTPTGSGSTYVFLYVNGKSAKCSVTVNEGLLGDVNGDGDITLADYAKVLAHVKKINILTDEKELYAADVNEDEDITLADYAKILAYVKKYN